MKRNYGVSFESGGKRQESKKRNRFTKEGATKYVAMLRTLQKQGKFKQFKNPRVFRAK